MANAALVYTVYFIFVAILPGTTTRIFMMSHLRRMQKLITSSNCIYVCTVNDEKKYETLSSVQSEKCCVEPQSGEFLLTRLASNCVEQKERERKKAGLLQVELGGKKEERKKCTLIFVGRLLC